MPDVPLLTIGLIVLGAIFGLGISVAVSELFIRILPLLLVLAGTGWALYFITTDVSLPAWMFQGALKPLAEQWWGAILLGLLGSLSIGLTAFPLTALIGIRSLTHERVQALEKWNKKQSDEIAELSRRLAEFENRLSPKV